MVETRIAPRHRVMKPAKIEYGGIKTPCTIRTCRSPVPRWRFPSWAEIPATFNLIMPEDRLKLACRVVWRRDYRLGVAFE